MIKWSKKTIGRVVLVILGVLLAFRLIARECNLWICGAFVGVTVVYVILSDYGKD